MWLAGFINFSPIFVSVLGALLFPYLPRKRDRLLLLALVFLCALLPLTLHYTGIIFIPLIEFSLFTVLLLPMGVLLPYLLIEDNFGNPAKYLLVLIPAVCSFFCLLLCGYTCLNARTLFPAGFMPIRYIGAFIEVGLFACVGYGSILFLRTLANLIHERASRVYLAALIATIIFSGWERRSCVSQGIFIVIFPQMSTS